MLRTTEDVKRVNTEILEGYFKQYQDLKKYVEGASEEEKQREYYKHRLTIVKGIDKTYPALTNEMQVIVQLRYWYKDYQSDWAEIADELGTTTSRTKRLRDVIISRFSEAIGWA